MSIHYRKLFFLLSLSATLFIQSCDDNDPDPAKPGKDGYFVVNEGGFPNENASISYYDRATNQLTNDLFASVNGRPLGVQAQSMTIFEDKGYIMVQGSGKIEIIDADEYTSQGTITSDIENPRYFVGISSTKGYVSDWGADGITGTVKVIDLNTNAVVKTIPTGQGANRMLKVGDLVYVTNSGGYGYDNTVKVIDTSSDAVTNTIIVGDNPNSIQQDAAGNVWVSSSGMTVYNDDWTVDEENSTKGSISKIGSNNTEVLRMELPEIGYGGAGSLSISPDGETLYYISNGSIYALSTTATALPSSPLVSKAYYGLSVDPFTGNLIGTLAPNFSSAGTVEVMDDQGSVTGTYTAGIGPNGAYFK